MSNRPKAKPVGHVEPAGHGFVARVYRYGNGRKLPEPRILLTERGLPFPSRLQALDALNLWRDAPRSVPPLKA